LDFSLNSKEFASDIPHLFLADSITATCSQRHIHKNGILFSLKYCTVKIFHSTHLSQNPPGTKTQVTFLNLLASFSCKEREFKRELFWFSFSIFSASIQTKFTLQSFATPA
jgi:hypothetical protein